MIRSIKYFLFMILITPCLAQNPGSAKRSFLVGYFEAGSYYLNKVILNEIHDNLDAMVGDSLVIEFSPNAYMSAEWDRSRCRSMAEELTRQKDLDLVIAAGPWVVEDLLAAGFKKPIVAIYQFDPAIMGLCDTVGRPIAPNLTVTYSPNKLKNDLTALTRLFSPRKLGFLYFPSGGEAGRLRDEIYKIAGDLGATVYMGQDTSQLGKYSFFLSFRQISKQIDVLYLPPMWGTNLDMLGQFFYEATLAKVPTFSSEGMLMVEKGATAADCYRPYRAMARFNLNKMIRIFRGAVPASLPTILDDIEGICINQESANQLGMVFPRKVINDARVISPMTGDTTAAITLAQALAQGIQENAGLLESGSAYKRAEAAARNAYRTFYPELYFEAGAAVTDNGSPATYYEPILNRELGADLFVEQKIFSYPAIKAVAMARKKMTIAGLDRTQAELDFKQTLTESYLSVLENEEMVEGLSDILDRLRELRDYCETGWRMGLTDSTELPLVEEQLVKVKIMLFDARKELRVSRAAFNALINRPPDVVYHLDRSEFTPEIMAEMVKKLEEYVKTTKAEKKYETYLIDYGLHNSPELTRANQSIALTRDLLALNKKRFLPEISLRAGYSYARGFEPRLADYDHFWIFGGVIRLPLFSPGRGEGSRALEAELDRQMYAKDQSRYEHLERILSQKDEMVNLMTTLPLDYFVRNLSAANLEMLRGKYNSGRIGIMELLRQEQNSTDLAVQTVSARYRFFKTYAQLLYEAGAGYLIHGTPEETAFYKDLEDFLK